jgi:hypothetical protein
LELHSLAHGDKDDLSTDLMMVMPQPANGLSLAGVQKIDLAARFSGRVPYITVISAAAISAAGRDDGEKPECLLFHSAQEPPHVTSVTDNVLGADITLSVVSRQ